MKRIKTEFGLYCDELQVCTVDVLADVEGRKVDIVSVQLPWRCPGGQVMMLEAIEMLSIGTMSELKDYVRGAYGAQDHVELWDLPDGAA